MQGAWRPSLSIATVLTSIQLLMSEPNPDDPLVADVVSVCPPGSPRRWTLPCKSCCFPLTLPLISSQSSEFKYNKPVFLQNARQWTEKHARPRQEVRCSCGPDLAAATSPDVRKCLPGLPDGFRPPEQLIDAHRLRPSDHSAK